MSSGWNSFWSSGGGSSRFSPFGSNSRGGYPPNVTDADFEYITSDDIARPGRIYNPQSQNPPSLAAEEDVLLIKHKTVVYPCKFPPYCIPDGKLLVRDVKARAAVVMDLPEGTRVSLIYKGQALKDDNKLCRDYGLKNHSEILCIVGEGAPMADEESEADDASQKKRGKNKKSKKSLFGRKKESPEASRPVTPAPAATATPKTAYDKINGIASHFHTKIVPLCVQFTASPPEDPKKKDMEHKRLSETIMNDVLLKLDAVETDGDTAARDQRRALVREVQGMLNKLDSMMS